MSLVHRIAALGPESYDYSDAEENLEPEVAPTNRRTGRNRMLKKSASDVLGLVQAYEWTRALERIRVAPQECRTIGPQGRTALHFACDQDAPPAVVRAILSAYPEAAVLVGTSRMNPLHITCSSPHASRQVVEVLLEVGSQVQTSMRDLDGDSPLHTACRCNAPIEVLELLLKANPAMVEERDEEGLTPLHRLWVRYYVTLGADRIKGIHRLTDLSGDLGDAWRKTLLLLKAAQCCIHLRYGRRGRKFRPVHAAAMVDCPRDVVRIATELYPEALCQKDENGMTPLLLAAASQVYRYRDLSNDGPELEERIHGDQINNGNGPSDEDDESKPSVIQLLVRGDPRAAEIPDRNGRLPLHIALRTNKHWRTGVKYIVEAYPAALSTKDKTTGFYPFLLAACGDKADLGTLFRLLRKEPNMLKASLPSDDVAYAAILKRVLEDYEEYACTQ